MYQVTQVSRSEFVPIRGLLYHVRRWGAATPAARGGAPHAAPAASQPPLVLVHGWMDVAASFQFVVDALEPDFVQGRQIIAPDWRGYGLTDGGGTDNFWFPDYIADLEFLLDHYAADTPVDLVGHSMGGNVAMLYAGSRPERVRRLVNLEGFGGPPSKPAQAPARYAKWLQQLKQHARGEMALRSYPDLAGVVQRLTKTNPRLARDAAGRAKADWLARNWARQNAAGQWEILGDPAHKIVNANLLRIDELLEIYKRIRMPLLAVEASDDEMWKFWNGSFTREQYHERLQLVPQHRIALVHDAGHMLHHDQPEQLAQLLQEFLGAA